MYTNKYISIYECVNMYGYIYMHMSMNGVFLTQHTNNHVYQC